MVGRNLVLAGILGLRKDAQTRCLGSGRNDILETLKSC